jgi:hypothetical protein
MAKYLLLKHYRGAPAPVNDVPMDQWTADEISAHVQYMHDFAARLEGTGEFVDSQALAPEGTFVRDLATAAGLYAEAARQAPNLPERDHLMRQAARLNARPGR